MRKTIFIFLFFVSFKSIAQISAPNGIFSGCKPANFTLIGPDGFSRYEWSNGAKTKQIEYYMLGSSDDLLDSATVGLTCYDANNLAYLQQPVVLRTFKQPSLISSFNGRYNYTFNDSIKCDLVLTHGNDLLQYVFTFIQTDGRGRGINTVSKYISNTRWCKLSNVAPMLKSGKFYYVTVHAKINNVNYCKGNYSIIGIGITPNGHGDTDGNGNNNNSNNDLTISSNLIEISTFPNPTYKDCKIVVDSDDKSPMEISIYNIAGQLVYRQNFESFPIFEDVTSIVDYAGSYKVVAIQNGNIKISSIERL
ncbi:MAG: hypothetical protein RL516_2157 [Bacteroidota bacterium]|jgi:hypothetical protein